ncbi:unnamed protein product [Discosporangium mesarthrocarpum]
MLPSSSVKAKVEVFSGNKRDFLGWAASMRRVCNHYNCAPALTSACSLPIVHNTPKELLKLGFSVEDVRTSRDARCLLLEGVKEPSLKQELYLLDSPAEAWEHLYKKGETQEYCLEARGSGFPYTAQFHSG